MTNGKKLSEKSIGAVCAVVSIGAFIILWYWGTQTTQLGLLIPGPFDVLKAVGAGIVGKVGRHSILAHAGYSLLRVMIGFICGIVYGVNQFFYAKFEKVSVFSEREIRKI